MDFEDSELEEIDEVDSDSDGEEGSDYADDKDNRPAVQALLRMKLVRATTLCLQNVYSLFIPVFCVHHSN